MARFGIYRIWLAALLAFAIASHGLGGVAPLHPDHQAHGDSQAFFFPLTDEDCVSPAVAHAGQETHRHPSSPVENKKDHGRHHDCLLCAGVALAAPDAQSATPFAKTARFQLAYSPFEGVDAPRRIRPQSPRGPPLVRA